MTLVDSNISYDLDLDTRLSEETTVLVESYTVRTVRPYELMLN